MVWDLSEGKTELLEVCDPGEGNTEELEVGEGKNEVLEVCDPGEGSTEVPVVWDLSKGL